MLANTRILIAGAGDFGHEVEQWMLLRGVPIQGWLDDQALGATPIDSYEFRPGDQVLVAVGSPAGRLKVVERLATNKAIFHGFHSHLKLPTHRIGGGSITCPYSIISDSAVVGDFVHINLHSTVGHHVKLGDFCTLSSHVDLCGHVEVGNGVFFGSGARVMPGVKIGNWAKIGAGAVVHRDVPTGGTVIGPISRRL